VSLPEHIVEEMCMTVVCQDQRPASSAENAP